MDKLGTPLASTKGFSDRCGKFHQYAKLKRSEWVVRVHGQGSFNISQTQPRLKLSREHTAEAHVSRAHRYTHLNVTSTNTHVYKYIYIYIYMYIYICMYTYIIFLNIYIYMHSPVYLCAIVINFTHLCLFIDFHVTTAPPSRPHLGFLPA